MNGDDDKTKVPGPSGMPGEDTGGPGDAGGPSLTPPPAGDDAAAGGEEAPAAGQEPWKPAQ